MDFTRYFYILDSCSRSSIKSDEKDLIMIFIYNYQYFLIRYILSDTFISSLFYISYLIFFYHIIVHNIYKNYSPIK